MNKTPKRLILICGPNGVGKSTACRALVERLPNSALIDSDYCRYMHPFSFTAEEIAVVISNISTMMCNYFQLSTIENVIFQYGFHGARQAIFDSIRQVLTDRKIQYQYCPIILECALDENIRRMQNDLRDTQRIERAIAQTRHIYDTYDYPSINVTRLSPSQTVDKILEVLASSYGYNAKRR